MRNGSFGSFIIILALAAAGCAAKQKRMWVYDREEVLTSLQEQKLDSLFNAHEIKTTNEIVLVTTPNYGSDTSILFYSVNFLRVHGIGKKDKNNGVVIVYCGAAKEVRIGTGYGTEKVLKDEIAWRILQDEMIPEFKQGKTFEGLWKGSIAIVTFLEKPENKIR
jgi:uncharacterized protein